MDYNRATTSRHGFSLDDKAAILYNDTHPDELPGLDAPVGSVCHCPDGTIWVKKNTNLVGWDIVMTHNEWVKHYANYAGGEIESLNGWKRHRNTGHEDYINRSPISKPVYTYTGYRQTQIIDKPVAIDPYSVYRISARVMQRSTPGDWSAYQYGDRHRHYMGFVGFDEDNLTLIGPRASWYHHPTGGSSYTELSQPLTPGDTQIHVVSNAGWNDISASTVYRGVIIFGYKSRDGYVYPHISNIYSYPLFDHTQMDRTANVINLTTPLPASMANPDDPNGTWPVGTKIANTAFHGGTFQYNVLNNVLIPATDTWYRVDGFIAGYYFDGLRPTNKVAPGTAYIKPIVLPNYTNLSGGNGIYPDTGPNTQFHVADIQIDKVDVFVDDFAGSKYPMYYDADRDKVLTVETKEWDFIAHTANMIRDQRPMRPEDNNLTRDPNGFIAPYDLTLTSATLRVHKTSASPVDDLSIDVLVNGVNVGRILTVTDPGARQLTGTWNNNIDIDISQGSQVVLVMRRTGTVNRWDDLVVTLAYKGRRGRLL